MCTATHDCIRHGTLTLFAALNHLDGRIIRRTAQRHVRKAKGSEILRKIQHARAIMNAQGFE